MTRHRSAFLGIVFLAAFGCLLSGVALASEPTVEVYAAGSLRQAMTAMAQAFEKTAGIAVKTTFGPSGVLRERIEKGERPDMLASADFSSPQTLHKAGLAWQTVLFTRNKLCATGRDSLGLTPDTVLARLLDPAVRLGTSTPKADPAGDYAWKMFELAETVKPGSAKLLSAKADMIVGGPNNSAPVNGKHPVAAAFADGKVDMFLGYCSANLPQTVPGLVQVHLPPALSVQADYGLALLKNASPDARLFALFILSLDGQKILAEHGFAPVALP
ncbi:solute-binding protein [Desulfovibrio aerotolerans]|uniref:Solute-binding protein n=1 Tax=Solidesulfovibrio aerotolerans TaxID=295255 RepID=A0A7C9N450_9BACT|nr:extracellular solute-binding protein [Solidesulfovibrio aerotolerans]MYL85031.1 solute-binding protein [Solidesulfovibrio aerotolerans]